jgi:hypothetical protein
MGKSWRREPVKVNTSWGPASDSNAKFNKVVSPK